MRKLELRRLIVILTLLVRCAEPPAPASPPPRAPKSSTPQDSPRRSAETTPARSSRAEGANTAAPPPRPTDDEIKGLLDSAVGVYGGNADSVWSVKPRPSWVTTTEWRPEPEDSAPIALADIQLNFVGPRPQKYHRILYRNRDAKELEGHRMLKLEFLPPNCYLELHTLQIRRGAEVLSQIDPTNIRFAKEKPATVPEAVGLPRRMVAHEPALLIRSADLQIGDILELEYTIQGIGDPRVEVLSTASLPIPATLEPADLLRYRLIADPNEPPLVVRRSASAPAPKQRRRRGRQEYLWEIKDTMAPTGKGSPPEPIQVSNFGDWSAVAGLMRTFFTLGDPLPEVRALAATFSQAHEDPAARARAALDYVQHQIAFDSTDLGRWTSEPRPIRDVLRRRAADCKGKVSLLMALLRELGIESEAVLVNLDRLDLRARLPSPIALNHVILAVRIDDREVFVDPTVQGDRGDLWSMPRLQFRTGLSVAPGRGLVDIPHACDDPEPEMATRIRVHLGAPGQPTRVEFQRSIRRMTAAELKQRMAAEFAGMSADAIGQNFTGRIGISHTLGEVVHRDDQAHDLTLFEADIVVPNLWRRGEDGGPVAPVGPSYMDQSLFLIVPDPALLTNPNWHDFHRVDTVIDLPEGATVEDGSFELELPGLQVRHEVTVQYRQVVVRSEVRACGLRVGDPRLILATLADLPRRMALPVRG